MLVERLAQRQRPRRDVAVAHHQRPDQQVVPVQHHEQQQGEDHLDLSDQGNLGIGDRVEHVGQAQAHLVADHLAGQRDSGEQQACGEPDQQPHAQLADHHQDHPQHVRIFLQTRRGHHRKEHQGEDEGEPDLHLDGDVLIPQDGRDEHHARNAGEDDDEPEELRGIEREQVGHHCLRLRETPFSRTACRRPAGITFPALIPAGKHPVQAIIVPRRTLGSHRDGLRASAAPAPPGDMPPRGVDFPARSTPWLERRERSYSGKRLSCNAGVPARAAPSEAEVSFPVCTKEMQEAHRRPRPLRGGARPPRGRRCSCGPRRPG